MVPSAARSAFAAGGERVAAYMDGVGRRQLRIHAGYDACSRTARARPVSYWRHRALTDAERPNGRRRPCGEAKAGACRPPGV
jgi:hypothetical protein